MKDLVIGTLFCWPWIEKSYFKLFYDTFLLNVTMIVTNDQMSFIYVSNLLLLFVFKCANIHFLNYWLMRPSPLWSLSLVEHLMKANFMFEIFRIFLCCFFIHIRRQLVLFFLWVFAPLAIHLKTIMSNKKKWSKHCLDWILLKNKQTTHYY